MRARALVHIPVGVEEEWAFYTLHDGREWRDGVKPEPQLRYWHHPESGCVFTTVTDEPAPNEQGGDGALCEEISFAQFIELTDHYASIKGE